MLIIDQQQKFDELCNSLIKENLIFLDTEFCRRNSYYPKLSLLQIPNYILIFIYFLLIIILLFVIF
jgi:ribonuclease D